MAIGFFFLAADELAFLHEGMDKLLHQLLQIKEDRLTDRLDDLIPLGYAVFGLGVLVCFRSELRRFRGFWPIFVLGMALMLVSVGLDLLTNRKDILTDWLEDKDQVNFWWTKLNCLEEGSELLAETVFLGMFLRSRGAARKMARPQNAEHHSSLTQAA
jgi:hypothetical protein